MVAICSMAPLLAKDGVGLACIGLVLIILVVMDVLQRNESHSGVHKLLVYVGAVAMAGVATVLYLFLYVTPPTKWPYLGDALIVTWSYIHIAALYVLLYVRPELVIRLL